MRLYEFKIDVKLRDRWSAVGDPAGKVLYQAIHRSQVLADTMDEAKAVAEGLSIAAVVKQAEESEHPRIRYTVHTEVVLFELVYESVTISHTSLSRRLKGLGNL